MRNWKILVVDDIVTNQMIIKEYLTFGPYDVDVASHGAQAWEMLQSTKESYDVVILDRMMPVMDGMALLGRMKSDARFAEVPVIMQTAAASPEHIREGMAAGCYYYLTKPYTEEALLGILQATVDELRQKLRLEDARAHAEPAAIVQDAVYTFKTPDEATRLSVLLSVNTPAPSAVSMGLSELMLNAIEHGNLGIRYEEKTRLKLEGGWDEEISRRLASPEYGARRATVRMHRSGDEVRYTVTDEGAGFDWQQYLEFDAARAFDPNGRGIAMANKIAFQSLRYEDGGRRAEAVVSLPAS